MKDTGRVSEGDTSGSQAELEKLRNTPGGDEWLRLLYSSYSQRFQEDSNRIWNSGQILVPLALAAFVPVMSLEEITIARLLLGAVPSSLLIWFWHVIAENHRAFRDAALAKVRTIEVVLGISSSEGKQVDLGRVVRAGAVRRARLALVVLVPFVWLLLVLACASGML